jgi:hypothetical protein
VARMCLPKIPSGFLRPEVHGSWRTDLPICGISVCLLPTASDGVEPRLCLALAEHISVRNKPNVEHPRAVSGQFAKGRTGFNYLNRRAFATQPVDLCQYALLSVVYASGTPGLAAKSMHETTTALTQPDATSAFSMLHTPPSM